MSRSTLNAAAPAALRAAPSIATIAAIGATACMTADLVHEALGHGIVSWLTGDRIESLSTVALQNAFPSRLVAAAGTCANGIAGVVSLLLLRRTRRLTPLSLFLWVLGAFNLFNVGYMAYSALGGGGDWGNVIAGLQPAWAWRLCLGLAGLILYAIAVRALAASISPLVNRCGLSAAQRWRLAWPAYLAAGLVLTVAALLNPIGPSLVLVSGIGASFGLNWGLLMLPGLMTRGDAPQATVAGGIPFSAGWVVAAVAGSVLFIGILGPGIRF